MDYFYSYGLRVMDYFYYFGIGVVSVLWWVRGKKVGLGEMDCCLIEFYKV